MTDAAPLVRAPAIVIHRRDATVIPLEISRALADALPHGSLEVVDGRSATLFFEGTDEMVDLLVRFTLDPAAAGVDVPITRAHAPGQLSPREREVLRLVAAGESNGQIAAGLGISINTVERHVSNVYRKIDARGRADATAWAIRNRLA